VSGGWRHRPPTEPAGCGCFSGEPLNRSTLNRGLPQPSRN
jgi:hypothetical protein